VTTHRPVPEAPWPAAPSIPIRCNECRELRRFVDWHRAPGHEDRLIGPPCQVCGARLEYRCSECGAAWNPVK
jgi:hypothetical protein